VDLAINSNNSNINSNNDGNYSNINSNNSNNNSNSKRQLVSGMRRSERDSRIERLWEEENARLRRHNFLMKAGLVNLNGNAISTVQLTVIRARGLPCKANGYVTLACERQTNNTNTIRRDKTPQWDAEFEFYVSSKEAELELALFDHHNILPERQLGYLAIPISALTSGKSRTAWFPLSKSKRRIQEKNQIEIELRLMYRDCQFTILTTDYQLP